MNHMFSGQHAQTKKPGLVSIIRKILLIVLAAGIFVPAVTYSRNNQRILIISLAKSGSSALFFSVKESMNPDSVFMFDARTLGRASFVESRDVLINLKFHRKGVVSLPDRHLDRFDKKILLIRDPRDLLISSLIYKSAYMGFSRDPQLRSRFISALIQKETDPRSISVKSLFALRDELEDKAKRKGGLSKMMQNDEDPEYYEPAIEFSKRRKDFFIFKYEQFVDKDFDGINAYLGMKLNSDPDLENFKHLARTKRYGNWKEWFTAEDVEYFRPILKPYMEHFGYADDWSLSENPVIKPEHCSKYFKKLNHMQE